MKYKNELISFKTLTKKDAIDVGLKKVKMCFNVAVTFVQIENSQLYKRQKAI